MDAEALLLGRPDHIVGAVDYLGRLVSRSSSGGWRSASFVIGVQIAEQFAFYGVALNLISYLMGPLGQSTASAAASVNAWNGVGFMLPLLGAFVADSYLGRYATIVLASILYILGLGMLTLSTVLRLPECEGTTTSTICEPSPFHVAFFYSSLYLIAFAQGGHKPCVQAFGADQFDQNDPQERSSRSSFFNWGNFGSCCGILIANIFLSYIQDNISWTLGFGIPCIALVFALFVFLLGSKTYRFYRTENEIPFPQMAKTFWAMATSFGRTLSTSSEKDTGKHHANYPHFPLPSKDDKYIDNVEQSEEATSTRLLQLFPIWASCLMYAVVYVQPGTLFTKQGSTMDRRIGSSIQAPPAVLQSLISITLIVLIPIYDNILVPTARRYSKLPSGITMLQRIGTGIFLSILAMVIAAFVEMKRLETARDLGLVDQPGIAIPMSLWWLVPQYVFMGASIVFTIVGMQEFFYDQVPDELRSLGLALYLSILGVGSFITSLLILVIDRATSSRGASWFSDNLNEGHLDYFYWLLAGLSALGFLMYMYLAQAYCYKKSAHKNLSVGL